MSRDKVWIDGCFDFFHHGHANAILQSKRALHQTTQDEQSGTSGIAELNNNSDTKPSNEAKYTTLVAGVHSDEDITINKGPTVMNLNERTIALQYNKWVDDVVPSAPYVTDPSWMDRSDCFWVAHGDDITTDANGRDCYDEVRKMGRLRIVKRTGGVSTTDLIKVIMDVNDKSRKNVDTTHYISVDELDSQLVKNFGTGKDGISPFNNIWLLSQDTSLEESQIVDFEGDLFSSTLIYGSFDLFNPFHIKALEELQYKYTNIIIGITKDGSDTNVVNIMNLNQRSLCVLQCSLVNNVIIGIDHHTIDKFSNKININELDNEFSYLKNGGIEQRILDNWELYRERQLRKGVKSEIESKMQ